MHRHSYSKQLKNLQFQTTHNIQGCIDDERRLQMTMPLKQFSGDSCFCLEWSWPFMEYSGNISTTFAEILEII